MATTVTVSRGRVTGITGWNNQNTGQHGSTPVTLFTAPAGVSRVICNSLAVQQITPAPFDVSTGSDLGQRLITNFYVNNNYNSDGSTRILIPCGMIYFNGQTPRTAVVPMQTNPSSTSSGTAGIVPSQPMWYGSVWDNSLVTEFTNNYWGFPNTDIVNISTTAYAQVPNNFYMAQFDQLQVSINSGRTTNTVSLPTYAVTYSFTLITET